MPEGSVFPTGESLKYFSDLLAPARGQGNGSILAAFGKKVKPQAIFWPRVNLADLPSKFLLQVAECVDGETKTVNRMFSALYKDVKRARV